MNRSGPQPWRQQLRRKIGGLLLAKLLALLLLRSMFFSGEHRQIVDEAGLARRLAVEQAVPLKR